MHWDKQIKKTAGVVHKGLEYLATAKAIWQAGKIAASVVGPMLI